MSIQKLLDSEHFTFHFGPTSDESEVDYKLVSPFVRSLKIQLLVGVFLIPFVFAEIHMLQTAIKDWQDIESLSDIVAALFSSAWVLGWSMGVIPFCFIYLLMWFGQQTVLVHSGRVDTIVGLPWLAARLSIRASDVLDVKLVDAQKSSVFEKVGQQLQLITVDGRENSAFGCRHSEDDRIRLHQAIITNALVKTDLASKAEIKSSTQTLDNFIPKRSSKNYTKKLLKQPIDWQSKPVWILVIANLIPLFGTLFLDWDLGSIMVLYWAETAILALYSIISNFKRLGLMGAFPSLFTLSHAGGFMAVHFLFIWTLFVENGNFGNTPIGEVADYLLALWPALIALIFSHGYSNRHYSQQRASNTQSSTFDLYSRIGIMHVTIILGGGLAMILGSGTLALAMLIALKTSVDLKAHAQKHAEK